MKRASLFAIVGFVLLLGANAYAQDQPTQIEVSVDYSLLNFHPSAYGTTQSNLSGGGGSLVYYTPIRWLGLKMDLQGYGSQPQTFTIPAGNALLPNGGQINAQGNMFTYMFGPVIKKRGKIEPYGQILFGGAHSNLYGNAFAAVGASPGVNPLIATPSTVATASTSPTNDAFAMTVGLGLDIHLNRKISIRPVEVGYLLTQFGNSFTGGRTQNSFRYAAGMTFNFK